MARKPRNKPRAEFHHITNRGASRSDIYRDIVDQAIFLDLLDKANQKFEMFIHAYCLMGNHYHLLAQFPHRNMPQVMHWIGMCYSTAFNRKYGTDGRLCRDRYFNKPVENDAYLLTVARYIHQNPTAFNVDELSSYVASSYQVYLDIQQRPDWMRTDLVLGFFNNDEVMMREFMEARPYDEVELPNRYAG